MISYHNNTIVWYVILQNFIEVSASVSLSKEQESVNKRKGSGAYNDQICKKNKSIGLRKTLPAAEWEDNNDHGK